MFVSIELFDLDLRNPGKRRSEKRRYLASMAEDGMSKSEEAGRKRSGRAGSVTCNPAEEQVGSPYLERMRSRTCVSLVHLSKISRVCEQAKLSIVVILRE